MAGSIVLARHLKLETVQVEEPTGIDAQGKPTYDSPVDIEARLVREDKMTMKADGSYVQTNLTAWVPADETVLPDTRYRLTYSSETFIVEHKKDVKNRNAVLVHRRIRCRKETG